MTLSLRRTSPGLPGSTSTCTRRASRARSRSPTSRTVAHRPAIELIVRRYPGRAAVEPARHRDRRGQRAAAHRPVRRAAPAPVRAADRHDRRRLRDRPGAGAAAPAGGRRRRAAELAVLRRARAASCSTSWRTWAASRRSFDRASLTARRCGSTARRRGLHVRAARAARRRRGGARRRRGVDPAHIHTDRFTDGGDGEPRRRRAGRRPSASSPGSRPPDAAPRSTRTSPSTPSPRSTATSRRGWPVSFADGRGTWNDASTALRCTDWFAFRDPGQQWERPFYQAGSRGRDSSWRARWRSAAEQGLIDGLRSRLGHVPAHARCRSRPSWSTGCGSRWPPPRATACLTRWRPACACRRPTSSARRRRSCSTPWTSSPTWAASCRSTSRARRSCATPPGSRPAATSSAWPPRPTGPR